MKTMSLNLSIANSLWPAAALRMHFVVSMILILFPIHSADAAKPTPSIRPLPTATVMPARTINSNCDRCQEIQVECVPVNSLSAAAEPLKCTIHLSTSICEQFGFCEEQDPEKEWRYKCKVTLSQFQAVTQCRGLNSMTPVQAKACCMTRHEFAHICDPLAGQRSDVDVKCTEVYAENVDWQCFSYVGSSRCSALGTDGSWSLDECKEWCRSEVKRTVHKVWDACMCALVSSNSTLRSEAECCSCTNECHRKGRVWNVMPPICRSILGNESAIEEEVETVCSEEPNGFHGCAYWIDNLGEVNCTAPTPTPSCLPSRTPSISGTASY